MQLSEICSVYACFASPPSMWFGLCACYWLRLNAPVQQKYLTTQKGARRDKTPRERKYRLVHCFYL